MTWEHTRGLDSTSHTPSPIGGVVGPDKPSYHYLSFNVEDGVGGGFVWNLYHNIIKYAPSELLLI